MGEQQMTHPDYQELLRPNRVWSRAEVLQKPNPVPQVAGMYAWYFRNIPSQVPLQGCITYHNLTLLYVGLAPRSPRSRNNLRKRIKDHYSGNAYGSTLRTTLGCLLSNVLDVELRRVSRSRITFGAGEQKLSDWMSHNAYVVWQALEEPWRFEAGLIQCVSLPLNLEHNQDHVFHATLTSAREQARSRARELPILE